MTEKKQKTRDFAALERRATKKPWVRLKLAPSINVGGIFAVIFGAAGMLMGMWACGILMMAGIICAVVGYRDDDVRIAKWWYDQVIDGPNEQLRARAARSISIRSVATSPALLVGGIVWLDIACRLGLSFPSWILLIWLIPFVVSCAYFLRSALIWKERRDLSKIESYQRDRERIEAGGADE